MDGKVMLEAGGGAPVRTPEELSQAVLRVMQATPEPRLREIMVALVRHLHGFVREVGLTEAEFREATAVLARMGRLTDERHNEFVLMAGSLGVSALVCLQNNTSAEAPRTAQNLLGPFWRLNAPRTPQGGSLLRSPTPGEPLFVQLHLHDAQGRPVAGAEVDVWHCAPNGLYENQDEAQAEHNLRGRFLSDDEGGVAFRSVRPVGYPIPTATVVGELLQAQGRHPFRPAHLHVLAYKPGFKTLVTQLYDAEDPRLASDVQFGVTETLSVRLQRHEEPHPQDPEIGSPWYALQHRLLMQEGAAVWPKAPIA